MRINIEFIEPVEQRYPTCGDYWIDKNGDWQIRVSKMGDSRSEMAVAQHEQFEMAQAIQLGIPLESIDKFDIEFEQTRMPGDESEPGDDPKSPYFEQHQQATAVELIYCLASGLSWTEHEKNVLRSLS